MPPPSQTEFTVTEQTSIQKNYWYRITENDGVTSAMIVPGGVIINHYETVYGGNSGQNVAIGLVFVPKCTIVKTDRKTKQGNPLYGLDYPSQPPPIPYP
jgi:hypothetical protein